MKEVPSNLISTKDLLYLKDLIKVNLTGSKVAKMLKESSKDVDVKTLLTDTMDMHSKHFNKILNIIG